MITSVLLLGFLIGLRHAFEPDHVAAVASMASGTTSLKRAVLQGSVWGLGHTLTLFAICGLVMATGTQLSETLAGRLEIFVGFMLVALGLDVIRRVYRDRVHFHTHRHAGGVRHFHAHSHLGDDADHDPLRHDHAHPTGLPYRALVVGLMHGAAGSAALVALTVQATPSLWSGFLYVALFGAGSIAGMALFSVVICIPLRSARALTRTHNGLQLAIGGGTAGLGLFIVVSGLAA